MRGQLLSSFFEISETNFDVSSGRLINVSNSGCREVFIATKKREMTLSYNY